MRPAFTFALQHQNLLQFSFCCVHELFTNEILCSFCNLFVSLGFLLNLSIPLLVLEILTLWASLRYLFYCNDVDACLDDTN